jgi:hypothetical protein
LTTIALTSLGVTLSAPPLDLFVAGMLSVLLLGFGLTLIGRGTRRTARTHKEPMQLRKDKTNTETQAATDRDEGRAADHRTAGGT